jgi:hypothetical protein
MFIGKLPKPGKKFEYKMVSTGKGRATCGAFTKDGKHVIYASTHLGADTCPPVPDRKNMAIAIYGLCMIATIFLWLT